MNGKPYQMKCPVEGCEVMLESTDRDGILKAWDIHRERAHRPTTQQWAEAAKRIEASNPGS